MAHADSFRINISIASIHRLTARILDVSNAYKNTNVPIHEIVCVRPPPYYLNWFEISYPNAPLNRDYGQFCLQFVNGIQGTKPDGRQWNRLLDAVETFLSIRRAQLIMLSTSIVLLMEQCSILQYPLMIFSILLITRTHFLN